MKVLILFLFASFYSFNVHSQNVDIKTLSQNNDGLYILNDSVYTGNFYGKNSEGGIAIYGTIKNGKWEGTVTWLFSTGQKKRESKYIDGKKEGLTYYWYINGQMKAEIKYRDDKNIAQRLWYEDGRVRKIIINSTN